MAITDLKKNIQDQLLFSRRGYVLIFSRYKEIKGFPYMFMRQLIFHTLIGMVSTGSALKTAVHCML